MYIDSIGFLLPSKFKDQIWWKPQPDIDRKNVSGGFVD